MGAEIKIPSNYTITSTIGGMLDLDLDNIRIKEIPTITLETTTKVDPESKMTLDTTVDMGLDDIRIKELPVIQLQASMKPTRVHFPTNLKFGLCSMGMELLSFTVCGESMVVVEDYVPHHTERCD